MARSYKYFLHLAKNFAVWLSAMARQAVVMAHRSKFGCNSLRKGRYTQAGQIYLITTNTRDRLPWFTEFNLASKMAGLIEAHLNNGQCLALCWVIMPDHLHLLVQLQTENLNGVVNRLKSASARKMNSEIGRSGPFWQPGFHDHALRREEDVREVARYIIGNPIRADLVKKYGDYPFWNAVWL